MDREDIHREIEKINDALNWALEREAKNSEANAAQHCSEKVLYSPLYLKLDAAKESLKKLVDELSDKPKLAVL